MPKATFAIEVDDDEKKTFKAVTKPEVNALLEPIKDRIHGLFAKVSSVIEGNSVRLQDLREARDAADELHDVIQGLPDSEAKNTLLLQLEMQQELLNEFNELKKGKEGQ